jgi:chromosome segregation ATPase
MRLHHQQDEEAMVALQAQLHSQLNSASKYEAELSHMREELHAQAEKITELEDVNASLENELTKLQLQQQIATTGLADMHAELAAEKAAKEQALWEDVAERKLESIKRAQAEIMSI